MNGLSVDGTPQRELLRLIRLSKSLREPLEELVQQSIPRRRRFRLSRAATLRRALDELRSAGQNADAVETLAHRLPPTAVAAIRLGRETGTTADVYDRLLQRSTPQQIAITESSRWQSDSMPRQLLRTLSGLFFMSLVMSFLSAFILPSLREVMEEFEVAWRIHPIFAWISTCSPLLALFTALAVIATLAWMILAPVGSTLRIRKSDLLHLLSLAVDSGRPVASALVSLSKHMPSTHWRDRLTKATRIIDGGVSPPRALQQADIVSGDEAQALELADNASVTSWILRHAGNRHEQQSRRAAESTFQAVSLLLLAIYALLTAVIAITVVSSIYSMVRALA